MPKERSAQVCVLPGAFELELQCFHNSLVEMLQIGTHGGYIMAECALAATFVPLSCRLSFHGEVRFPVL